MKRKITTIYTVEGERLKSDLRERLEKEPEVCEVDVYSHFVNKGYISMVGRYYLSKSNTLWCSFPKYYSPHREDGKEDGKIVPDDTDKKTMTQIIDVMDKLRQNDKNIDEFSAEYDFSRQKMANKVSPFALSEYLIRDYTANGIYVRQKTEQGPHVRGKTSWPLTIKKEKPVISCHSVVYGKIWKKHRIADYDNPITQLHICVLQEASEVQGLKGLVNDISFPAIDMQISSMLSDDRKRASAAKIIRKEMSQVFTDRDISLLKALLAWCEQPTKNYKFAGSTNSFNLVWEWVNDAVFGNQSYKNSSRPVYHLRSSDSSSYEKFYGSENDRSVAIPDTIYYKEEDSRLYVYDSKYYTIKNVKKAADDKEPGTVTGLPSNSDIIKQVAYLKGIKNSLKKVKKEPKISRNIFLLPYYYDKNYKPADKPYDNGLFSRTGYVEPGNYDRLVEGNGQNGNDQLTDDDRVELYFVHPEELYGRYLRDDHYNPNDEDDRPISVQYNLPVQ